MSSLPPNETTKTDGLPRTETTKRDDLPRTETTKRDGLPRTKSAKRDTSTETTKMEDLIRTATAKMDDGWRETFWNIVQTEMENFVQAFNANLDDEYSAFDEWILERRVYELERLGLRPDDTPESHSNGISSKYIRKADVLTDIRAVEYLRVIEKDRARRHRASKGFRKAYNICPRDLGKEITKAPREVIDTLNKRADLVFTKMNKIYGDQFKHINQATEFILTSWLSGQQYFETEIKYAEGQVGLHWEALNFTNFGTIVPGKSKDVSNGDDDSSLEGGEEAEIDYRESGVAGSFHDHPVSTDNHP